MIAKHKGFGQTFDSAPMVFPEQESAGETGGTSIENHYIKNLYQIQNLTEENHLYHQNLRFVTNILEKKLEQRVVPSVEKLVERTIQEELPGVEKQIVHEMAEQGCHTLVKEGGVKELNHAAEQLYKETERQKEQLYRETEKQKEQLYRETERQEKLLHKETEVRTEKLAGKLERELRITEKLNKTEHEIQTEERKLSVEQNRHTETTNLTEQEILLRKIENIYYSSTQNHFMGMLSRPVNRQKTVRKELRCGRGNCRRRCYRHRRYRHRHHRHRHYRHRYWKLRRHLRGRLISCIWNMAYRIRRRRLQIPRLRASRIRRNS